MQQTLEGEEADRIPQEMLDQVEFHLYETNATPVLKKSKLHFREECVEKAVSHFKQTGMDEQSDEELEQVAELFVESVFSSVWDKVDGAGYSLWIRHKTNTDSPEHTREYPIYIESPIGTFMSSFRHYSSDDSEKVSDTFLTACGQITDGSEETSGWSNCSEEVWNQLNKTEKKLFHTIRNALVGQTDMSVELSLLLEKGQKHIEQK